MKIDVKKEIKALLWQSGAMSFVAVCAYVLQVGDVFALDPKTMVNIAVMAFLGLVVGRITKHLNK